jgi:hypothetical protein
MPSIITAGDASNGLVVASGNDGAVVIQSGPAGAKVDALSIAASGATTLATGLAVTGAITANSAAATAPFIASINGGEAMRIDSSGNLLVGTTSSTLGGDAGKIISDAGSGLALLLGRTGDGNLARFYRTGTQVGSINVTASATAYNTSSDYRLKEDWQPMTGATERVKALKPVNFAWKADGSRVDGFLAHEAQEVVPECVTGVKDAVDAEGKPAYQGIDQSKLVPLLTAALQEALTKIDSLTARIEALESV